MSWHYRVGLKRSTDLLGNEVYEYGIVEYYDTNGQTGWTDFVKPCGDTRGELIRSIEMMLTDIARHRGVVEFPLDDEEA
jgi:hypothetical protein